MPLNNKQCMTQPFLINLHLNEHMKGHVIIYIDAWEIVILLMIYPKKYMLQTKQKT